MFSRTYSQGIRTVIRMLGNRIQKINQRKQLKIKAFYQTTRRENHYLIFLTFFVVVLLLMIWHYQLNIIHWLHNQYWSHLCDFLVVVVFAFFFCWTPFHSQRLMFVMVSKRLKHWKVLASEHLYMKWNPTLKKRRNILMNLE